jgi:hypothetical protein
MTMPLQNVTSGLGNISHQVNIVKCLLEPKMMNLEDWKAGHKEKFIDGFQALYKTQNENHLVRNRVLKRQRRFLPSPVASASNKHK